jgi:hypothetical protein
LPLAGEVVLHPDKPVERFLLTEGFNDRATEARLTLDATALGGRGKIYLKIGVPKPPAGPAKR